MINQDDVLLKTEKYFFYAKYIPEIRLREKNENECFLSDYIPSILNRK